MTDNTIHRVPTPEQLKGCRMTLGRTQKQMAAILNVAFVTYSRWEKGHTTPQPKYRVRLNRLVDLAARQAGEKELTDVKST
jgi:DNA-binding XRE family transcriptional regulator